MCDPLSMMSLAVSTASGVAGYAADAEAAEDQNDLHERNRLAALQAFEDKQRSMNLQISQERESAALEKFDTALEGRAARATNTVAVGEAGVSGLTVDALARDFSSREQRFNDRVDKQTDWTVTALEADKRGQSYEALDRINSQPRARKPSFVGAGLRIAAGGLSGYSQHKKVNV